MRYHFDFIHGGATLGGVDRAGRLLIALAVALDYRQGR